MERNFCDKCDKEIFKNRFSNKLNRVCFLKDSYRSGENYKESEVKTFELCDDCYNFCFNFIKNIHDEGEYMSRMTDSIRNNTIINSKHIVDY